ncbi:MAG: alpha-2-macroglobulin, partial [Bacteroidota bacterium]
GSTTVKWSLEVPKDAVGTIGYRVTARAGNFTDGEEAALPVLTNRTLLTEALPLFVRGGQKETFTLENLRAAPADADHLAVELKMVSNPAWESVKALPYLQEYPYECTEQLVNRLFANRLAQHIVASNPAIETVFDQWAKDEKALQSPLQTNEQLKSATLAETPWVMDARSEAKQRARIAQLFDQERVDQEIQATINKLLTRQGDDGGMTWFSGGRSNWYITQYTVEQLYKLRDITQANWTNELAEMTRRAVAFADKAALENWQREAWEDPVPAPIIVHYLYLRTLTDQAPQQAETQQVLDFWWMQAEQHWLQLSLHHQALLGVAAQRKAKTELAQRIYNSLRERALYKEEFGRYWKYNNGWYWYQLPVETHTRIMELYQVMDAPAQELTELKIWLLRHKETNRWETTKATAAAVYSLLHTGDNWLAEAPPTTVRFPKWKGTNYETTLAAAQAQAEAGTGAYRVRWKQAEVTPQMATVRLQNRGKAPSWGGLYWQYFAQIDQVPQEKDNPLRIERQLLRKANDGQGDQLFVLDEAPAPGDRITVRLTIRTDRDMEFVHLKDLRASGLEPVDQLSGYRYQGRLGYYQQTTDLGTHFFLDYLPKGEYVLEYDLRVFHRGDFSGGLATLQCMYAPKFVSHSEGTRLSVE